MLGTAPIFAKGAIDGSLCIGIFNTYAVQSGQKKYKKYGQHFIYAHGHNMASQNPHLLNGFYTEFYPNRQDKWTNFEYVL